MSKIVVGVKEATPPTITTPGRSERTEEEEREVEEGGR